jgi:hypothetical protein
MHLVRKRALKGGIMIARVAFGAALMVAADGR